MTARESSTPPEADFGFKRVPLAEKAAHVQAVFDTVAPRYDLMNDLMSFGLHRYWKWFTIALSGVRPGQRVLDLAAGTGDLALALAPRVGPKGRIWLVDRNEQMLAMARDRLLDHGHAAHVRYAVADAESLPLADDYFDLATMGFGLRNVARPERALAALHRVLRPGGQVAILEFSQPTREWLRGLYDAYSFTALPLLGRLVAGSADSYRYLAESIRRHPNQTQLRTLMEQAGFEQCRYHNLAGGIVALHRGYKC